MGEDEKRAQADEKGAAPKAGPEPEGGAEGAPGAEAEPEGGGEPKDGHGQPGINREKYRRDIDARDRKIAELTAKLDELAKSEEGRADLQKQLDELKADTAKERAAYELQLAGCRDGMAVKAAEALLPEFGGDIAKLKSECPFLFETKQTGSTGFKPEGGAGKDDEELVDRILGRFK